MPPSPADTDGVDGVSKVAGAVARTDTLVRARTAGLDARHFLRTNDSHSFFHALATRWSRGQPLQQRQRFQGGLRSTVEGSDGEPVRGASRMNRKGVSYDVGRVMGLNWRPVFDPAVVHRELEIIRDDLHCNAVRICGLDPDRLMVAAEDAIDLGLEVWLSPEMWNRSPKKTLKYIAEVAARAELLHQRRLGTLVFSVGSELTLFMRDIMPGRSLKTRMKNPSFWADAKAGKHNAPLNSFLALANEATRRVFMARSPTPR